MILQRKAWLSLTDQILPRPNWILLQTFRFTSFTKTTSSSLKRQTRSQVLHTSKHWVGFWRSSVIAKRWLLISWFLMSQRLHSTVQAVFIGYFGEAQTRSGMHVTQAQIWKLSRLLDLGPSSWLCHQSVAQPRATHLPSLLLFPLRGVKIMILCLPILF